MSEIELDECLLVFPPNPYADQPSDSLEWLEGLEEVFLGEELAIDKSAVALISVDGQTFEFVGTLVVVRTFDHGKRRLIRIMDVRRLPQGIAIDDLREGVENAFGELLVTRGKRRNREFPRWAARRLGSQLRGKWADSAVLYENQVESAQVKLMKSEPHSHLTHAQEIVAMERDAINVGLRIFDKTGQIAKQALSASASVPADEDKSSIIEEVTEKRSEIVETGDTPFLMSLPGVKIGEDAMIHHDATVFGDWSIESALMIGATEFRRGSDCVSIVYANRNNLEHTLGVDLIYYHHTYQAFTGIQYKKLRAGTLRGARYYPDKNLPAELARMRKYAAIAATNAKFGNALDYRLYSGMMHMKLCSALDWTPDEVGLTRGYLVPLDLWDLFFAPAIGSAPKSISADQLGRVINNDVFIKLVQDGWIGSRAVQAGVLKQIIDDALTGGRAVVLMNSKPCAGAT